MAQPATWQDVQRQNRDDPLFMCFRPGGGGTPAAAALPVGLYAPELDEVAAMFAEASGVRPILSCVCYIMHRTTGWVELLRRPRSEAMRRP